MKICRTAFARSDIQIITNGLLLGKMKESFWQTAKQFNITIAPTKYPINTDYDAHQKTADIYGVQYYYYGGNDHEYELFKIPLDIKGMASDAARNFLSCNFANRCTQLYSGKIYMCGMTAYAFHLNKYFNLNFEIIDGLDCLDIYQVNDIKEILDFLARPIPFCRYCATQKREYGITWAQSNKDITEWVLNA